MDQSFSRYAIGTWPSAAERLYSEWLWHWFHRNGSRLPGLVGLSMLSLDIGDPSVVALTRKSHLSCCAALPFELPLRFSTRARTWPVYDFFVRATCSGGPCATIRPPPSPPSGPRSIIQSACLITSR